MLTALRTSVVSLCLTASLFVAAPWSCFAPSKSTPAHLIRAEQKSEASAIVLAADTGAVCSDNPDCAKGVIADPIPVPLPSAPRIILEKTRKQAVLSLIHYPWEDLGFSVVFLGSRLGYRAMTLTAQRRIEIYARPGDGVMNQAYDLAHELGHAFDLKNNDEARRRKWCELRGIKPDTSWFGCDACSDYGTPAGDLAETFAYLLLGPGNFHSTMAPQPMANQLQALADFCQIEHLSAAFDRVPDSRKDKIQSAKSAKPKGIRQARSVANHGANERTSEPAEQLRSIGADGFESSDQINTPEIEHRNEEELVPIEMLRKIPVPQGESPVTGAY
jgi:hypothetical protein